MQEMLQVFNELWENSKSESVMLYKCLDPTQIISGFWKK
jgi:hypothetical protein